MMLESNFNMKRTTCSALEQPENELLPVLKKGRKRIVSEQAIKRTRINAEGREVAKDSTISARAILGVLDNHWRTEMEVSDKNSYADLRPHEKENPEGC